MKQTLRIILGSALIAGAFIKAVPAFAETTAPAANITIVHTADLDLSTAAGRRQLDHRLVLAAHEVCGTASDVDVAGKNQVRACHHNVLSDARAKSGILLAGRGGDRSILVASTR
jgi:UrcA family protein